MTDTNDSNTASRTGTDRPAPESSPSAGWRETAALMHAVPGLGPDPDPDPAPARTTPPDDDGLEADETDPDAARPAPAKDVLEVSS